MSNGVTNGGRHDAPGAGVAHVRNVQSLPEVLKACGVNPDQVMRACGVDPALFENPDNILTFSELGAVLAEGCRVAKRDDLGLLSGMRMDANSIGLAGLVAINAETVGEALEIVELHLKDSETGLTLHVGRRNGTASAALSAVHPDTQGLDHIVDGALAVLCNIMRQLSEARWSPVQVLLTRSRPSNTRLFTDFFRAPIQFGASENALIFDSLELGRSVPGRDRVHFEILLSALKRGEPDAVDDLKADVLSVLRRQIVTGPLTLARTAAAFRIADRTFARRLEHNGLTHAALVEQVKYETARSLLRSNVRLAEISAVLGYAEAGVFTRAFKRWSGETPKAWRLRHVQADGRGPEADTHQGDGGFDPLGSAQL